MTLTAFNITELGVFTATVLGGVAMVLKTLQQSKCKKIRLCGGCVNCDREVLPIPDEEEEVIQDTELVPPTMPTMPTDKVNIVIDKSPPKRSNNPLDKYTPSKR